MNIIRSRGHELFTEEINKVVLSAEDDKRVIRPNGIHTFAIGYYRNRSGADVRRLPSIVMFSMRFNCN